MDKKRSSKKERLMINSFKSYLIEEERTVFFTFGRMNPPTTGHEKLMNELAKQGKAVIFVSSYLPELLGVCDRIGVMSRGVVVETRPVKEWSESEIIMAAVGHVNTEGVAA